MRRIALILIAPLALLLSLSVRAQEKTIHLTSLEWPPYSGAQMDQQGASVAVARAAAEAMGYRLQVQFLPWARAVSVASDPTSGVAGYFPEYFSEDVAERFELSEPIGSGPLGFAESSRAPIVWTTLADLAPHVIGTVRDYVNTALFDSMVASGQLRVEAVNDDATNLRKIAAGRIRLAVIDRHVMNYLLANEPSIARDAHGLQFNSRLLENKKLYIAFQRTPVGEAAARVINAGLQKIDIDAVAAPFFD